MKYHLEIAISISCIITVVVVVLFLNQYNLVHTNQTAFQNNATTRLTQPPSHLVLNGCTTDSNGKGETDISCPNYEVFHFTRDPPIIKSKWTGVKLTIDNNQYSIQYSTPTGTNQYILVPNDASDLQRILSSPGNPMQQITRSFESEKLVIGNIFHQNTKGKPPLSLTKEELYQVALQLINQDRINHEVNPVVLNNVSSAQNHADDMLNADYFSHWNTDGVKPYVTYTKLGGRGAVDENISVTSVYCPTSNCNPNIFDPIKQINASEYGMVYHDAGSNWGHRDNILDPEHTNVDIGVAYNNEKFYFVEHFENNIVKWETIERDGNKIHLVGNTPPGYSLFQIDVFADPSPKPLINTQLNNIQPYNLDHYDQGDLVGMMLPRPAAHSHYPECSPGKAIVDTTKGEVCVDYVTYSNISTTLNGFDISPDISKWSDSGLHTIYVILKKQNGKQVDALSLTLEYLK